MNKGKAVKKAISVSSTDWHLKRSNIDNILDLIDQKIELARKLDVKELFCFGDVFDSRKAQEIDVLEAFTKTLDKVLEAEMTLWVWAGNHDKTDYLSHYSFLEPFRDHPALKLNCSHFQLSEFNFVGVPYFDDPMWLSEYEKALGCIPKGNLPKTFLLSHRAIEGSVNNDGSKVESTIKPSLFKDLFKVLLGHYHDMQQIGDNIFHIPSIQQNNFGENPLKGFTVLYEDGTHEIVKSNFKEYKTVTVNLDEVPQSDLLKMAEKLVSGGEYVRIVTIGEENETNSLNREKFTSLGVKLQTKVKGVEEVGDISKIEKVKVFNSENIKGFFKEFCEENGYDHDKGVKYINKKLP